MNVIFLIVGAIVVFIIAYKIYGTFLARKIFSVDDSKVTPAVSCEDGIDYVPTNPKFLMGQHFSAIAGAGPITGPIIAGILFGWAPALLWIILGSIFIGGVHDMGSLVASIRHKALSITEVVRKNISKRAWILFLMFVWFALVYVIVAFTDITSSAFIGTITLENGEKVGGGAIATSSLLYLILPLIMGLLLKFTRMSLTWATIIFLPLVGLSIIIGPYIPCNIESAFGLSAISAQKVWNVFLLVYCFIASLIPVWLLLQPRGHLGGYFLYASLITAALGLMFGGFEISYPAFISSDASGNQTSPMFPMLFITVACGACSGFHAMVSSGTTSKQLKKESDSKVIGYGAMLLEGLVGVVALACLMIISKDNELVKGSPNFIFASGIGSFVELIGIPAAFGISFGLMAFTTFVYDTLDVCTRLARYVLQELTGWRDKYGKAFAAAISIAVPIFLVSMRLTDASGAEVPVWKVFWNIFGASNQLLAALALLGISVWLFKTARFAWAWIITFIPALWMFIMSNWGLLLLIKNNWFTGQEFTPNSNPVPIISLILLLLSIFMAAEVAYIMVKGRNKDSIVEVGE
ncbi:MAG TPA: carbon starvation protein A [Prolixibacteraceae bacterium]|nr:carbon starvation protein A [Prolixibacteraceae bacterium]